MSDEWTSDEDEMVGGDRDQNRNKDKRHDQPPRNKDKRHDQPPRNDQPKAEDLSKKIIVAKSYSRARATTVGAALISVISICLTVAVFVIYNGVVKMNTSDANWQDGQTKVIAGLGIFLVMVGAVVVVQMYLVMHASAR